MASLNVGQPAPDFTLPLDDGSTTDLSSYRGRKLVLYFYPRADTPGCTIEAKDFSAFRDRFADADTEILGVSADPVKTQARFKTKHGLTIALASDEATAMLEAYGVWVQKSMYGKTYMGVERVTLLIDREGRIARVWPKVKVDGHVEEVLAAASAL